METLKQALKSLMDDHAIVLKEAESFKNNLLEFYKNGGQDATDFNGFVRFFHSELSLHTKKEEKILLPLHEKKFPSAPKHRVIFEHEHALMKKVFARFENAWKNYHKKGVNKQKLSGVMLEAGLTMVSILRDHTTFEDHEFFPDFEI